MYHWGNGDQDMNKPILISPKSTGEEINAAYHVNFIHLIASIIVIMIVMFMVTIAGIAFSEDDLSTWIKDDGFLCLSITSGIGLIVIGIASLHYFIAKKKINNIHNYPY